jgi:hypothetical protein
VSLVICTSDIRAQIGAERVSRRRSTKAPTKKVNKGCLESTVNEILTHQDGGSELKTKRHGEDSVKEERAMVMKGSKKVG